MSGKHIVFKVEVTSPVHGSFRAGDVGKNVDAAWAGDLVAGGYAAYTTPASEKADADAAADAAGKLTDGNRGGARTQKVERSFSASDLKAQRAAGVVTTGPTDNTVGAEGVAARVQARNAGRVAAPLAGDAAIAPAAAAPVAAAAPAPAARPAPATRAAAPKKSAPATRAAPARTVDKPAKGTSSRKAAGKASSRK